MAAQPASKPPQEPTLYGEITNKNEKEQIGELALYQNGTPNTYRGWIRINAKKAKADEKGYCYLWVEASKP